MRRGPWLTAMAAASTCAPLAQGIFATPLDVAANVGAAQRLTTTDERPDQIGELSEGVRQTSLNLSAQAAGGPDVSDVTATGQAASPAPANSGIGAQAAPLDTAAPGMTGQVSAPLPTVVEDLPEPSPLLSPPGPNVESLQQALAKTYQTNPQLMARRAELRRLDSAVALERAAGKPQVFVGANLEQELHITRPLGDRARSLSTNTEVSQVLFAGGRIRNSVRAAQTRVIAGRADLRATEGDLLTQAVAAYADVLRDREIRDVNLAQVRILQENLESTRARFRVRDLTLTDVAQSEARLLGVQSDLATAEARLQTSEENFARVVGARAGDLQPLPPLPPLPLTADQAVETTLANNADVQAFAARARAADYEVAATKAARMPTVSLVTDANYDDALGTADRALGVPPGTVPNSATNVTAGLSLRLPLYQGGAASARVRQAEEFRAQLMEEAIAVERLVIADARSDFSIWRRALTAISFNELAVAANEKALESVRVEQTVGARSILDVLNAEQELLTSKIALASARRDAYVAAFQLLDTMGGTEAADLGIDVGALYDPKTNYRRYSDHWSDGADGERHPPASTRNVSDQADSPVKQLDDANLGRVDVDE